MNEWRRTGAALKICKTRGLTAELLVVILSMLSVKENYQSAYVVYPPEGHRCINNSLLDQNAADRLVVDKAIS